MSEQPPTREEVAKLREDATKIIYTHCRFSWNASQEIADAILSLWSGGAGSGAEGWQPIATVRKDGTQVILYDEGQYPRAQTVHWNERHNRFETANGTSTGLNDEIAWTHWSLAPQTEGEQP